jgi:AraC-like DNA-binding protein
MLQSTLSGVEPVVAGSRHSFPRHVHRQFGIGVIEEGAQRSASGRGQVEAGPGDVITVNPGEVHDGVPIGDAGRRWRILYIDPALVRTASLDLSDGRNGDYAFTFPVSPSTAVASRVRRLFAATTSATGATGSGIAAEEALLDLLACAGEVSLAPAPADLGPLKHARERIEDDPQAQASLAELSASCGMSRFHFLRSFSRAVGLTPHAYAIQCRVDRARALIAEGSSLADAAAGAGFADQSHLTRMFVARYGLTPGAYAQAVRGKMRPETPRPPSR